MKKCNDSFLFFFMKQLWLGDEAANTGYLFKKIDPGKEEKRIFWLRGKIWGKYTEWVWFPRNLNCLKNSFYSCIIVSIKATNLLYTH